MGLGHRPLIVPLTTIQPSLPSLFRLTACAPTEHGQSLKHHLVEEQGNRLILQLVLQQVAVVIHIPALTGDRHALRENDRGEKEKQLHHNPTRGSDTKRLLMTHTCD